MSAHRKSPPLPLNQRLTKPSGAQTESAFVERLDQQPPSVVATLSVALAFAADTSASTEFNQV
jgi:hypothetical protein